MRHFLIFLATIGISSAYASVQLESVTYEAQGVTLKGMLVYDDTGDSPRPAVIVVHEWWGLGEHAIESAKKLAELGYLAFALDMYGDGNLTEDFKQAAVWSTEIKDNVTLMRERFEAAVKVIEKNKLYDGKHMGAIGYCFGGTVVLEMARAGLDLAGVVSFHGGLKTTQETPTGGIKARILVCHGADDPYVPAEEVATFEAEMRSTEADWQFNSYGGAVHSFTNPKADNDGARYHEKADKRSWADMTRFFEQVFTE